MGYVGSIEFPMQLEVLVMYGEEQPACFKIYLVVSPILFSLNVNMSKIFNGIVVVWGISAFLWLVLVPLT